METEVTASELENRAEEAQVMIVPSFDMGQVELISGTFGPFEANIPSTVPLWLAIFLKRRHKCHIVPPAWMDASMLQLKLEEERVSQGLTEIDFHYLEISSLLIAAAKDDIRQKQLVRQLVEDLFTLRLSKLHQCLKNVGPQSRFVNLTHVAAMELQTCRSMLTSVMEGLDAVRG